MADLSLRFNPMKGQTGVIKHLTTTLSQSKQNLSTITTNLQILCSKYDSYTLSVQYAQNKQFSSNSITITTTLPTTTLVPSTQQLPFIQIGSVFVPDPNANNTILTNPSNQLLNNVISDIEQYEQQNQQHITLDSEQSITSLLHLTTSSSTTSTSSNPSQQQQLSQRLLESLADITLTILNVVPIIRELIQTTLQSISNFYTTTPLTLLQTYPQYLLLIQISISLEQNLKQFSILFNSCINFILTLSTTTTIIDKIDPTTLQSIQTIQQQSTTTPMTPSIFNELTNDLSLKYKLYLDSIDEFTTQLTAINTDS